MEIDILAPNLVMVGCIVLVTLARTDKSSVCVMPSQVVSMIHTSNAAVDDNAVAVVVVAVEEEEDNGADPDKDMSVSPLTVNKPHYDKTSHELLFLRGSSWVWTC